MTDLKQEEPENLLDFIFGRIMRLEEKYKRQREKETAFVEEGSFDPPLTEAERVKHRLLFELNRLFDERNHLAILLQYASAERYTREAQATVEHRKELNAYNERCIESNLAIARATEALVKEVKDVKDAVWKSHLERSSKKMDY